MKFEPVEHNINPEHFQQSNALWNKLRLNDPWSVGYVSNLIRKKVFTSYSEWEEYYFQSGLYRKNYIDKKTPAVAKFYNNYLLDHKEINILSEGTRKINYFCGRTKEELTEKGKYLHSILSQTIPITEQECVDTVLFRVLGETWNGIIVREVNTVENIRALIVNADIRDVSSNTDYDLGVDYELFIDGILKCGLQIKPESYAGDAAYLRAAKFANYGKHLEYEKKRGAPVITLMVNIDGCIDHYEALLKVHTL
jgi:hypothetical protein